MANNKGFELPVVAKLDTSAAAIQELQNQLDKIGKKLKITIGQVAKVSKQEEEQTKEAKRRTNETMEQIKAERILFLEKKKTKAEYKASLEAILETANASEKELLTQNQKISLLTRINALEDKGLNSKIQKVKIVRKEVSELYKRAGQAELQRIKGEISPETYKNRIQSYLKYNDKLKMLGEEEVFTHSQKVSLSRKVEAISNKITQTENQSLKTQKAINKELDKKATTLKTVARVKSPVNDFLVDLDVAQKSGEMSWATKKDMLKWMLSTESKIKTSQVEKSRIYDKIHKAELEIGKEKKKNLETDKDTNKELEKRPTTARGTAKESEVKKRMRQMDIDVLGGQMSLTEQKNKLQGMLDLSSKVVLTESEALNVGDKIVLTKDEELAILKKIKAIDNEITNSLKTDSKMKSDILTKEEALETKRKKMLVDLENYQKKFPDVYNNPKLKSEIESTIATINNMKLGDSKSIDDADIAAKRLKGSLKEVEEGYSSAQNRGKGFFKTVAADFGKFTMWMVSATLVMGPIRKIREAFDFIAETDKNLTNIGLVLGKTTKQLDGLATSYNKLAMEMGVTTSEVLVGATEWFRQGKNFAETEELLRSTMMLSKLGAVESAQATEYLTSVLNGFKMGASQAVDVVDKLVAVDNAAATSVAELAVALQRSSNSASQAGVSIDELVGYVGTVSSVTRKSAESIGESFKTMFARLGNVKAGKLDEDGLGISDVEKALTRIGVTLRKDKNTFRDMSDVIQDIALKWKTLTQVEQNNVANAIAGKLNECPNIQKCIRLAA